MHIEPSNQLEKATTLKREVKSTGDGITLKREVKSSGDGITFKK
jgi:hypothetical protein